LAAVAGVLGSIMSRKFFILIGDFIGVLLGLSKLSIVKLNF
jgi:hypothetical protein